MSEYNIDDLMEEFVGGFGPCGSACGAEPTPLFNNNKQPMRNLLEQKRFDDFMKSNKLDVMDKLLKEATDLKMKTKMSVLSLDNVVDQLDSAISYLEDSIDEQEIAVAEMRAKELTAMIEVINAKPLVEIVDSIVEAFGIETEQEEIMTKEDIVKSFGLVSKKKAK